MGIFLVGGGSSW